MDLMILFIVPFLGTLLGAAAVYMFPKGIGERLGKAVAGFAGGVIYNKYYNYRSYYAYGYDK